MVVHSLSVLRMQEAPTSARHMWQTLGPAPLARNRGAGMSHRSQPATVVGSAVLITPRRSDPLDSILGSHPLLPSPTAALVPLAEDSRSASRALLQAKYPATAAAASLSALSATIVHVGGGPLICEYSLPYWKYTPPAPMTIATAIRASMFMWRGT